MRNFRVLAGLFAMLACASSWAAKPPVEVPLRGNTLVERLPRGYRTASDAARTPPKAATLATVQSLLHAAQRTGDARIAARAEAVLGALPAASRRGRDGLLLGAMLAQHRHDFPTALRLLGDLLRAEPLDATARHTRAQIHLVQGRIDEARRDCASLLVRDAGTGSVCVAAIALRTGRHAQARQLAERALAIPTLDPLLRRHLLVMRGEIASRSGEPADRWFQAALALDRHDVRTLSAYAAHLRRAGRPADVRSLLAGRATTETLQLHEALAAHALRSPDAPRLGERLARRFTLSRTLGTEPELRDEAELHLARGDARAALRSARDNFATQRDYEDVDVLLRAARAAGDVAALKPTHAWAQKHAIPLEAAP